MKKITFIITIFILLFAFSVQIGATEDIYKDTLRVGISYGNSALATASFYSDGAIAVYDANTDDGIAYIPAGMKIELTALSSIVTSN